MQKEINAQKAELKKKGMPDALIQVEIDKIYQKYAEDCTKISTSSTLFAGYNCEYLELGDVDTIFGPCNFDYYVMGDKKFYIFGEAHGRLDRDYKRYNPRSTVKSHHSAKTLIFSSFIYSLVTQKSEKNYDLFIEFSLKPTFEDLQTISEAHNLIRSQFKSCIFPRFRELCTHSNLRIHAVDARQSGKVGEDDFIKLFKEINTAGDAARTHPVYIKNYINHYAKAMFKYLLNNNPKILKQFGNIPEEIRQKLKDFLTTEIDSIDTTKPLTDERLNQEISTFIMDIYSLPRLFRNFGMFKRNSKQFHGNSNNIIYYAGRTHTERFKKFMNFIGIVPKFSIPSPRRCISYIDINQAFLNTFN